MSSLQVVATFEKNRRENVRVALSTYQGVNLVDLRVTVDGAAGDGTQAPTKKGVSLNIALLPQLRRALDEAEAQAQARGWLR